MKYQIRCQVYISQKTKTIRNKDKTEIKEKKIQKQKKQNKTKKNKKGPLANWARRPSSLARPAHLVQPADPPLPYPQEGGKP